MNSQCFATICLSVRSLCALYCDFQKGFGTGSVKPDGATCFQAFSTIMLALIELVPTGNLNIHEPVAGNERKPDPADT